MSSTGSDPAARGQLRARAIAAVLVAIVALDQATKHWAVGALDGGRTIHVVGTLRFALGFNSGFAFGRADGLGRIIGLVAIVVVVVLVVSASRPRGRASAWGLVLIAAGASGNVVDRLFRGHGWMAGRVVDFIDLQWWPVFNVADSAITTGAVIVAVASVLEARAEGSSAR